MSTPWKPNQYPRARRSDHVDIYKSEKQGEVRVHDPYQWLEEPTEETDKWTTAQDAFTRSYLDKNPDRTKLEQEIRANTDYAKVRRDFTSWLLSLNSLLSSSLRRRSSMMAVGIGTITAVSSLKQVS
jgi:hypothetical protein